MTEKMCRDCEKFKTKYCYYWGQATMGRSDLACSEFIPKDEQIDNTKK